MRKLINMALRLAQGRPICADWPVLAAGALAQLLLQVAHIVLDAAPRRHINECKRTPSAARPLAHAAGSGCTALLRPPAMMAAAALSGLRPIAIPLSLNQSIFLHGYELWISPGPLVVIGGALVRGRRVGGGGLS